MTCQHCGRESASALYCTWCGTRQGAPERTRAGRRADRYAAHPGEGVVNPGVLTTLFPHLARNQVNEFRWALLLGVGLILVLYLAGLVTASIVMGAILIPTVYILYLYEVRVYSDAPVPVLGLTIGAGVAVGIVLTLIIDSFAGTAPLLRSSPFGGLAVDMSGVFLFLVAVPIVQEVIKPLPALMLRTSSPQSIDGLVFGVAAGLGYAAAETIIHFSSVITRLPVQTDPANWIYPLATITILMPLMHGSTTGLIAGALWGSGRRLGTLGIGAIAAAIVGHIAFVLGSEVIAALDYAAIVTIVWQAIIAGALLVAVRLVLHRALLDEAASLGLSESVCANCDSEVLAAGFCPVCGMAMTAVPRAAGRPTGGGRVNRAEVS